MNTNVFQEFITLVTSKNYTAASQQLHMSHTTLYRHMESLQNELNTRLILGTNPIKLTSAGKVFLEKASLMVTNLDDLSMSINNCRSDVTGDVRILDMSPQNDCTPLISSAVFQIKQSYPSINISYVTAAENIDIVEGVKNDRLDIGFRHHYYVIDSMSENRKPEPESANSEVAEIELSKLHFKLRFCISREHPLFDSESATLADYAKYGFIFPANKTYQDACDDFAIFCQNQGLSPRFRHVETDGLFDLWMTRTKESALIVSENMLLTQMLPTEFFESSKVVAPADDIYMAGIYAVYNPRNLNEATQITLDMLKAKLN